LSYGTVWKLNADTPVSKRGLIAKFTKIQFVQREGQQFKLQNMDHSIDSPDLDDRLFTGKMIYCLASRLPWIFPGIFQLRRPPEKSEISVPALWSLKTGTLNHIHCHCDRRSARLVHCGKSENSGVQVILMIWIGTGFCISPSPGAGTGSNWDAFFRCPEFSHWLARNHITDPIRDTGARQRQGGLAGVWMFGVWKFEHQMTFRAKQHIVFCGQQ